MKLIKIDRNGSKHYEGYITCDKCGGDGIYKWGAMINDRPQYAGTCYKCEGTGKVWGKKIERTPEYEAKLAERREARRKAKEEEWQKERAKQVQAELERIEAEKARRAISQYVGEIGDKVELKATYIKTAMFEVESFRGYGTDTMKIHTFKDDAGNVIIWKTTVPLGLEPETQVTVKGTIKDHNEYRHEKQTVLTRCKVS